MRWPRCCPKCRSCGSSSRSGRWACLRWSGATWSSTPQRSGPPPTRAADDARGGCMELTTARLLLDHLRPGDADALFACRADPAVARFQGWRPASVAEARAFIDMQGEPAPGLWFQRAIRLRDGHALIGDLGVSLPATPG